MASNIVVRNLKRWDFSSFVDSNFYKGFRLDQTFSKLNW